MYISFNLDAVVTPSFALSTILNTPNNYYCWERLPVWSVWFTSLRIVAHIGMVSLQNHHLHMKFRYRLYYKCIHYYLIRKSTRNNYSYSRDLKKAGLLFAIVPPCAQSAFWSVEARAHRSLQCNSFFCGMCCSAVTQMMMMLSLCDVMKK